MRSFIPVSGAGRSLLVLALALTGPACVDVEDESPSGGVSVREDGAWDGYTLVAPRYTETAFLVDLDGREVHRWSYEQGMTWCYAELQEDGRLVVLIKEDEDAGDPGMYLELGWDGDLLRRIDRPVHHDFAARDDGALLLLEREYVEDDDVCGGTCKSDRIVAVDDAASVLWEWHALDHVDALRDLAGVTLPAEHEDWAHTNTLEILPEGPLSDADGRFAAGNLLFAMFYQDLAGVIDAASGEVVWAWGPGEVDGIHMPTLLEDGRMLIYDNGTARGWSRVLEIDPRTGEVEWQYVADPPESFFSPTRGSSQRLPNGNTLIAESNSARLFEIDRDGTVVWEYRSDETMSDGSPMPIYRAMRVAPEIVEPWLE